MKILTNKLPKKETRLLYQFKKNAVFFDTGVTTGGDPTNTTSTVLTTTHIWQK